MPGTQLNYLIELQKRTGLPTVAANVGPISSIHDRACELYASIHGLRTDFGYFHAQTYNHTRYGRDFSRKGPYFQSGQLGEIGEDGEVNHVHIIVHSYGAPTARYLEHLLYQGLESKLADYPADEAPHSPLFEGGQPVGSAWIKSQRGSSPLRP